MLLLFLDRIRGSALALRLAQGLFWSVVGAVSSRAFALLASVLIARILGPSGFGELGIIQSTNNLFLTFAEFSLGITATKYIAECRKADPTRAGRILTMCATLAVVTGGAIGLVMVGTSGWTARLLAAPHLRRAIAISALAVLIITVNEAQNGILTGLEAFKRPSTVQVASGVASLPISVLGAYFWGLTGAVFALVASQALVAALSFHAIRREAADTGLTLTWKGVRQEVVILRRFSLPTLLAGAVYMPSMWIANMILVNAPGGYGEMGVFTAADRWRTAILFLPSLLGGVALPILASLQGKAASGKYDRVLSTNIKASALASLAVAAPVALLSPWIMATYGPGFRDGAWVLITLCTTSVAFAVFWIITQSLLTLGRVWTMFSFNLGWAATLLTSEWLLRALGARGLALAYLLAETVRLTAALVYAHRLRHARITEPLPA